MPDLNPLYVHKELHGYVPDLGLLHVTLASLHMCVECIYKSMFFLAESHTISSRGYY